MTDRPLLAYLFAHVPRQMRSAEDRNKVASLRRQLEIVAMFAKARGQELTTIPSTTTHRGTTFTTTNEFSHAARTAKQRGADLVVADVGDLLSRTPLSKITDCVAKLDALDVVLWIASTGQTWQSLSPDDRIMLVRIAGKVKASRSNAIKRGLRDAAPAQSSSAAGNHKLGNAGNTRRAHQRAANLRAFVEEEVAKLPAGAVLSPSALAAALNAAGIVSARGGHWSHNTAKNLIARVERLRSKATKVTKADTDR